MIQSTKKSHVFLLPEDEPSYMKRHPAFFCWRFILEFPSDGQESRRMLVFHTMKHRDFAGLNDEVSITKANGNINESTLQRVGRIWENSQLTQVTSFC